MASSILPIRYDIHPAGAYADPPAIQLYADAHGLLKGTFCRHVLHGTGGGQLVFDGDGPVAEHAAADAMVLVYDERLSAVTPWSGFVLDRSRMKVLSSGTGARVVQWGGNGLLSILARGVLLDDWHDPNQVESSTGGARGTYNEDGQWTWLNQTIGAILARGLGEGINQPLSPLADVSLWASPGTARTQDADGTPWTGPMEFYQLRIGTSILEIAAEAVRLGKTVQMGGDLTLKPYESFGTDRSGAAFGAGVIRFEKGANIANDLDRQTEQREAYGVLVRGSDEVYVQVSASDPGVGMPFEPETARWEVIDFPSNDPAALYEAGAANLRARLLYGHSAKLRLRETGDNEAEGIYLLGPSEIGGHGWVGDTARIHSGTGDLDYNEADFPIAAVELRLDDAWETWVEAGSVFIDAQRRAFEESVRQIVRGPGLQLCSPTIACEDIPDELLTAADATNGDVEAGASTQWSGEAVQTSPVRSGTNSYGASADTAPVITYTFDPAQVFSAGVRYVLEYWAQQGGSSTGGTVRFGVAGDESTDAHAMGDSGGWGRVRICWTPAADRTGARLIVAPTQATASYYVLDDLVLFTTPNDDLAGTSPRAARCDHAHHPPDIVHDHDEYLTTTDATDDVTTVADAGATHTIEDPTANTQDITLTEDCTVTMPAPVDGKWFVVRQRQDGTGGWTATYTGVVWGEGGAPGSAAASTMTPILFTSDGTSWYGFPAGGDAAAAALIVREVGGSDIDPVAELEFDADDFVVTDQTGGVARVALTVGATDPPPHYYRPLMDGAGNVVTDGGTGEAIMAFE